MSAAPGSPHKFILALDQGTTSSRSLLFDATGRIVALAQREFTQHFPQPGWVEHDADRDLGDAARDDRRSAARGAAPRLATSPPSASPTSVKPRCSGIARTGEPVAPAIVWQDRRTAAACERLRAAGHEPEIGADRARCSIPISPAPSSPGCSTMFPARGRARSAASSRSARSTAGCCSSSAAHRRHVTDVTNASRTLLLNLHTGDWDDRLLELLDVPRACLPEMVDSCLDGLRGDRDRPRRHQTTGDRASPATSRRRCSARPASRPAWPRTPTAPAVSRS